MKRLLLLLFCLLPVVISVFPMEDQPEAHKRKQPEHTAKIRKTTKTTKKAKLERHDSGETQLEDYTEHSSGSSWQDLPPETIQLICEHALTNLPKCAFKMWRKLKLVSQKTSDLVSDTIFLKIMVKKWLQQYGNNARRQLSLACGKNIDWFNACLQTGDVEAFNFIYKFGASVVNNPRVIEEFVRNKNIDMIQRLMQRGVELFPSLFRQTGGDIEIIKLLLANGALHSSPAITRAFETKKLKGDKAALFQQILSAVLLNDTMRVELLLYSDQRGRVDPGFVDDLLYLALEFAAANGYTGIVELLLAEFGAGLKPTRVDALIEAAKAGHASIVELLIAKGTDVNNRNVDEEIALFCAAQAGHTEVVKVLLAAGAAVEIGHNLGITPLQISAKNGHKQVVALLMEHGADINAKLVGTTALHMAAYRGRKEVVEQLIDAGANVNQIDALGKTAIQEACFNDYHDVAKLIIDKTWGDINALDGHGYTLLMYSAIANNAAEAEMFLRLGADITVKDPEGKTALDYALELGSEECARKLIKYGA